MRSIGFYRNGENSVLRDNLLMLRNLHEYSQEEVAEKVGVSRQAYAKWEKGETMPDIERCQKLATLYDTTIDTLVNFQTKQDGVTIPPAPKGKHMFGTLHVNERGQIVIPKKAREVFHIKTGDSLLLLGDETEGLALIKTELFEQRIQAALTAANRKMD